MTFPRIKTESENYVKVPLSIKITYKQEIDFYLVHKEDLERNKTKPVTINKIRTRETVT